MIEVIKKAKFRIVIYDLDLKESRTVSLSALKNIDIEILKEAIINKLVNLKEK